MISHPFFHLALTMGKRTTKAMAYLLGFALIFSGLILSGPGQAQQATDPNEVLSVKETPAPMTAGIEKSPAPGANQNLQPSTSQVVTGEDQESLAKQRGRAGRSLEGPRGRK